MTTIYASVENERIVITKRPLIVSGGVQQCKVVFTLSDYWDGLQTAAIFADRQKKNVYRVLLDSDSSATVPWEVLTEKGAFWLGVEGVSSTVRYTSELIRYAIAEGAKTGGDPQPPTPGIYDQILDKIDKIDEVQKNVGKMQENVGEMQENIGEMQENVGKMQEDIDTIQGENGDLQNSLDDLERRIDSVESNMGLPSSGVPIRGVQKIEPFNSVSEITIGNSVFIEARAQLYDGYNYFTFAHDFDLPIADSGQIKPVVLPGNRFGFKLSDSYAASMLETLTQTFALNLSKESSLQSSVQLAKTEETKSSESTISDNVPDYFRSMLADKEAKILDALNLAGRNRAAFVFLTDPHWDRNHRHSPALIRHILEHTPIKTVICGGDILSDTPTDREAALALGMDWQNAFRFCGDRLYCTPGSHDLNSPDPQISTAETLTDKEIYNLLPSGPESREVVYGGYCHYYADNHAERTRYVFLDTGRASLGQGCTDFLIGALNSMPKGWHGIILAHAYQDFTAPDDPDSVESLPAVADLLEPIIDGYNAKLGGHLSSLGVEVDYDFSEAAGTVTACIGGGLHFDKHFRTAGGIPIILCDCDGRDTVSGIPAEAGTVDEQAFTVVIADYDDNKIRCIRIGRGDDLTLDISE